MATTVKIGRSCDCPPCTTPNVLCGCPVDYFALICLSFPGTPGTGFDGRTFFGFAGSPVFGVWRLGIRAPNPDCLTTLLAVSPIGGPPCGLGTYSNCPFGFNMTVLAGPATVTCSPLTLTWGTVVLTTACTLLAPSGPCVGLAVPNAPFLTVTGSTAGLNGTYRLIAGTSVGGNLVDDFDVWGQFPGPTGTPTAGGTCTLFATMGLSGAVTLTIFRNSDGHSVTGTGGSVSPCAPFVVSGTVTLTGTDATVPGFGETVTISVTA